MTKEDIETNPGEESSEKLPPVDFTNFILSLSTSALLHLGEIKNPTTGEIEPDVKLARHTIDLIELLQDKTKGNLTEEESKLFENMLHDLRMRYVSATSKKEEAAKK